MSEPIRIYVPAVPVATPRPRATIRGGKPSVYVPDTIKTAAGRVDHPSVVFKASCRMAAADRLKGRAPMLGPLRVDLEIVFPRPRTMMWERKPMPRVRHTKKPDRDNVDKSVLDALTEIVWKDDSQVCDGRITKWIAAGDEQPHVLITIEELD